MNFKKNRRHSFIKNPWLFLKIAVCLLTCKFLRNVCAMDVHAKALFWELTNPFSSITITSCGSQTRTDVTSFSAPRVMSPPRNHLLYPAIKKSPSCLRKGFLCFVKNSSILPSLYRHKISIKGNPLLCHMPIQTYRLHAAKIRKVLELANFKKNYFFLPDPLIEGFGFTPNWVATLAVIKLIRSIAHLRLF